MIYLNDLKTEYDSIKDEIDDVIKRVLRNSSFILGKEVSAFEDQFAAYIGRKYCVGVSSCTAALHLALKVMGIGQNDRVNVPVRCVTADAEAVKMCGAMPVFYDQDEDTADATIAVHLYGKPLKKLKKPGVVLIEDCAQAAGAAYKDRKCGTIGDVSCFSFFPSKTLGCYGDGGAVLTDDHEIAEELRALRNHGRLMGQKHKHEYSGFNYRLDGLQAAVLSVKLNHIDRWIAMRAQAAMRYNKCLEGVKQVSTPVIKKGIIRSWYVYAVTVLQRDELATYLRKNEIQTGIHYPIPVHQQPAFKEKGVEFPEADKWAATTLSLPMYPFIKAEQIEYICGKIKEFYC